MIFNVWKILPAEPGVSKQEIIWRGEALFKAQEFAIVLGCYDCIFRCNGKRAWEILPGLEIASRLIQSKFVHHPDKRDKWNAIGLSTYRDRFIDFLMTLLDVVKHHPDAQVEIS